VGGIKRRIIIQTKTQDPIQKTTREKKGWGVAQVVECLPSKKVPKQGPEFNLPNKKHRVGEYD
jgi:hypothetical protein